MAATSTRSTKRAARRPRAVQANDLDLIGVERAAEILGCSIASVRTLYRSKAIPSARIGRLIMLREGDVRAYVANQLAS